jgi:peroxiredoxin
LHSILQIGRQFAGMRWRYLMKFYLNLKNSMQLFWDSVDGVWCHLAFSKDRKLRFPLLSDFEPKGEVARKYGVYRREDGVSERALFVIDKDGNIRWSYVSPIGVNPGAHGVLNALESLDSQKEKVGEPSQKENTKAK